MRTYYDIGLNLFTRSFPDPERIIADAEAAGICCILTGSEARENELVNEFVKTHDVYGTAGIHPHAADGAADKDLERIEEIILSNPKIVAVGECGLDYDRMYSTKENQLYYFKKLIALGEKLKKPLFLHDERRAEALWEAVKIIPPDRILLETDAPYLTPRGISGLKRTNVPQNIVYVARALAHYMGVSEEDVIRYAKINTERIFGL